MQLAAITNSAGLLTDPFLEGELAEVMAMASDVIVYSPGWQTDIAAALTDANRFGADLLPRLPSRRRVGIGILWPSVLSQDPNSPLNWFDALTFYSNEHRADVVGQNAGKTLLQKIIGYADSTAPINLTLIGHSFGCKVVCAAAAAALTTRVNLVLLQPAFESNALERGGQYGVLLDCREVRIFMTTSADDSALGQAFPAASAANWFSADTDRQALGYAGPTAATIAAWGGRLVVRDITAEQRADNNVDWNGRPYNGLGGRHSDIFGHPQLNQAIADFMN